MSTDYVRIMINLAWNNETQAWVPRATFINLGQRGQKSSRSKPTPSIILTLQSGEQYQSDKEAYRVSLSRALDKIKQQCPDVRDDRIKVVIRKEIAGKSKQVDVDDLN